MVSGEGRSRRLESESAGEKSHRETLIGLYYSAQLSCWREWPGGEYQVSSLTSLCLHNGAVTQPGQDNGPR